MEKLTDMVDTTAVVNATGTEKISDVDKIIEMISDCMNNGFIQVVFWILLVMIVFAGIYYFLLLFKEEEWYIPIPKMCYNCISKIFSLNTLLTILFLSAISLVGFCIYKGAESADLSTNLTILTISFTFAAIVPYIIGRSIAKNEIDKIIEDKFDDRFKQISGEYSTSLFSLRKNNAHTRRIAADLLKERIGIANKEWAMGWAAEAIIGYALIHTKYDKSKKYAEECIKIFNEAYHEVIMTKDWTPPAGKEDIHERTLKSILSMHAITELYEFKSIPSEDTLHDIETKLLLDSGSIIADNILINRIAKSCKISDLPADMNEKVIGKVEVYLRHIKSEARRKETTK